MRAEDQLDKAIEEYRKGTVADIAREAIRLLRQVQERRREDGIRPTEAEIDIRIDKFLDGTDG